MKPHHLKEAQLQYIYTYLKEIPRIRPDTQIE